MRAKVIEVDFAARRRVQAVASQHAGVARSRPLAALQALGRSAGFLIFWRPPAKQEQSAE